MMEFLYFPEDKTDYIIPAINFLIFFIGAVLTFFVFKKISKREQLQAEELEKKLNEMNAISKP